MNTANVKKLTEHPGYRLRVGDWRIVYLLDRDRVVIQVIRIAQRGEVYGRAKCNSWKRMASQPSWCCITINMRPCVSWPTMPTIAPHSRASTIAPHSRASPSAMPRRRTTVPLEVVDRLMAGENPFRVWREHRASRRRNSQPSVGITPAHVSKLESAKGEPSVALLRRLSKALQVDSELLLAVPRFENRAPWPPAGGVARAAAASKRRGVP